MNMDQGGPSGPGILYLVGTPIGNLGDLSPRAAEILGCVDFVAAEDTRRTLRLLNHLGIRKHLESFHEHNWRSKQPSLIAQLQQGRSIALVSDAGMPCVSDPGAQLVQSCAQAGIQVIVIPGPSAAIAALTGSGLPADRFSFDGFLPASGKSRKERLLQITAEKRTCLLYEAPHRLRRTLDDLIESGLAGRHLVLARELTKKHEEFIRMTVGEAASYYSQTEPRGEYVLVLEGSDACAKRGAAGNAQGLQDQIDQSMDMLRNLLREGHSTRDAARLCAERTGRKRNELYQAAVRMSQDMDTVGHGGEGGTLL
jgi:16S rRNA (cytidine1402-2'-O)-methyltransferase